MSKEFDKNGVEVLFKCGRHCCICRRFRPTMIQVHHIVEKQDGGSDELDNLLAVCMTCHSETHTSRPFARRFTPEELKRHRDRVYDMIRTGVLIPPEENDTCFPRTDSVVQTAPSRNDAFLSKEAIEILIAAANEPSGAIRVADTFSGYAIFIGGRNIAPDQTPRVKARFENALDELSNEELLKGDDQIRRVTHKGYLLADELEATSATRLRPKVELKDGMYYLAEPVEGYANGPFCTRCFDADGKLITLIGPGRQPGIKDGLGTIRTEDGRGYTCMECVRRR